MHKLGTRFIGLSLLAILTAYPLLAYVVVPALWQRYEHQPGLANLPMVTTTKFKHAADPMNVALVGSREELITVMTAALVRAGATPRVRARIVPAAAALPAIFSAAVNQLAY